MHFCEGIPITQVRVLFGEKTTWLLAKTNCKEVAVYKDVVVQLLCMLLHAPVPHNNVMKKSLAKK